MTYQSCITLFCIPISGQPGSLGCLVYSSIHDSIMPSKMKLTLKLAPDAHQVNSLKAAFLNSSRSKLSNPINKNAIISKYNVSCQQHGIKDKVTTVKKVGQVSNPSTILPSPKSSTNAWWSQAWIINIGSWIWVSIMWLLSSSSPPSLFWQMKMLQTSPWSITCTERWSTTLLNSRLWIFLNCKNQESAKRSKPQSNLPEWSWQLPVPTIIPCTLKR